MGREDRRAARLTHLRRKSLTMGDPVPTRITLTSMYHLPGDPANHRQYGRFDNPTWEATEELLYHLEDAPAVAFPSGMAAISALYFGLLKSGDHILLPSDGYYTTRVLAERFLRSMGISFDTRPTASFLDDRFDGYRLVFIETPSNPGLDICDIQAVLRSRARRRRHCRRGQHDNDTLRSAPAQSGRRYRHCHRYQGAKRSFRRAVRSSGQYASGASSPAQYPDRLRRGWFIAVWKRLSSDLSACAVQPGQSQRG